MLRPAIARGLIYNVVTLTKDYYLQLLLAMQPKSEAAVTASVAPPSSLALLPLGEGLNYKCDINHCRCGRSLRCSGLPLPEVLVLPIPSLRFQKSFKPMMSPLWSPSSPRKLLPQVVMLLGTRSFSLYSTQTSNPIIILLVKIY